MTVLFIQFHQNVGCLFAIHQHVQVNGFLQVEFLINFGYICRIKIFQQFPCLDIIFLFDDFLQIVYVFFRQFCHGCSVFSVVVRQPPVSAAVRLPKLYSSGCRLVDFNQLSTSNVNSMNCSTESCSGRLSKTGNA